MAHLIKRIHLSTNSKNKIEFFFGILFHYIITHMEVHWQLFLHALYNVQIVQQQHNTETMKYPASYFHVTAYYAISYAITEYDFFQKCQMPIVLEYYVISINYIEVYYIQKHLIVSILLRSVKSKFPNSQTVSFQYTFVGW